MINVSIPINTCNEARNKRKEKSPGNIFAVHQNAKVGIATNIYIYIYTLCVNKRIKLLFSFLFSTNIIELIDGRGTRNVYWPRRFLIIRMDGNNYRRNRATPFQLFYIMENNRYSEVKIAQPS